jgi:kinesin family protein 6/9
MCGVWSSNEEEALNLLFVGDTNRIISSTPMNMASSRSHCIFTAHILACKVGKETVRKSKLNLVDLAGSERVWKTGVDGQVLSQYLKFLVGSRNVFKRILKNQTFTKSNL